MPKDNYYLPSRTLVSQDDAAVIEPANVPRSKFIGAKTRKTSFNAGWLVPFFLDEILPGDHMNYEITAYIRLATPIFPIFDQQRIDTFFFFIPNRLVWDNWPAFMGEVEPDGNPLDYLVPTLDTSVPPNNIVLRGGLLDHLGIMPTSASAGVLDFDQEINVLPIRMYRLIYNEWFRDQNLIDRLVIPTDDGPDTYLDLTEDTPAVGNYRGLKKRAKSHDYFTSALPWPQKFSPAPIPLAGLAPIIGLGTDQIGLVGPKTVRETGAVALDPLTFTDYGFYVDSAEDPGLIMKTDVDGVPLVFANLAESTGVTINVFRQAFLINQLLERDARGGTRYVELLRSHFGVISPDFRLQRPEYIGGGQTPLTITPIAQTAQDDVNFSPIGTLGGAGAAAGHHKASYAATEHGFIMALINVRSELSYQQGLHKMFSRRTRYDYYWPSFAGLGEQAILKREIQWFPDQTIATQAADIFGYQERWNEYRGMTSDVTGAMRSGSPDTLEQWHIAQDFTSVALNQEFIEDSPPMMRVLAQGDAPEVYQDYYADIMIRRTATRALPTYGTPVTLGRF